MFDVTRLSTPDLQAERAYTAGELHYFTVEDLRTPLYQQTLTRLERCDRELAARQAAFRTRQAA